MTDFDPPSPIQGEAPVVGPTLADQAVAAAATAGSPKPPRPPKAPKPPRSGNGTGLKVGLAILAGLVITGVILFSILAITNATDDVVDDATGNADDAIDQADGPGVTLNAEKPPPKIDNNDSEAISQLTQDALAALEEEVGSVPMVLSISVYPTEYGYVIIEAQDPDKPANVDTYTYYAERGIDDGTPVNVSGQDYESELFDPNTIGWEGFPVLLDDARQKFDEATTVELENAEGLTYVSIESGQPFNDGTIIRVDFDGGDRNNGGYVMYTLAGELVEVYPAS